ncbi:MAG: Uma2 family endonuclease [Cyanobacteria bacterium P01_C01_bin.69]
MIALQSPQRMTVEAYLDWEPRQELRYEFVDGEVFAMAGGTIAHNDIAVNLLSALRPHLRKQGCRINIADAKVNVTHTRYRYSDLVVTCDERDKTATDAILYPKLIVEVLSAGTEALDRGDKLKEYCRLPTLEEYVLVSATQISIEIYRRTQGRFWLYTAYQLRDKVKLESVDFEFPVTLAYEDIAQFQPLES